MVDKLWYDWQKADPSNFWSFGGGMTALVTNFVPDATFPTGAPPFVNVRNLLTGTRSANEPFRSSRPRSQRMVL